MSDQRDTSRTPGTVYLVGAGPGDPGLLTLAGADAIARADVIVYDRLINPSLLKHARPGTEMIYAGKASSHHTLPQEEINAILTAHALQGKCVCRLKGGDPFVFGRGGEEADYLRSNHIPYVVIPGVTSAIAGPAYAGIPVTDRSCASSFAVITGHRSLSKSKDSIDWAGIAKGADTLVFLMGLANLPVIAEELVANGRSASTPVAAIQEATTLKQRVVIGTLADIAQIVKDAQLNAPVTIVVGQVVSMRESIGWFENRALFGRRILIVGSGEGTGELHRLLEEHGADVIDTSGQPTPDISSIDACILTCPSVVHSFQASNKDEIISSVIACLGLTTTHAALEYGLKVGISAESSSISELVGDLIDIICSETL
ncbi:MAG: uroporphyrinogen-III C-methyltransferase [Armatimonadota bacterium]